MEDTYIIKAGQPLTGRQIEMDHTVHLVIRPVDLVTECGRRRLIDYIENTLASRAWTPQLEERVRESLNGMAKVD